MEIIIGAVIGATGPILLFFIKYWISQDHKRNKIKINSNKSDVLIGTWNGIAHQKHKTNNEVLKAELHLKLSVKGKNIMGNGIVIWKEKGNKKEITVSLYGFFINEDYIKIDYYSDNNKIKNFGTTIYKISADGDTLEGKLIGFGHRAERIITSDNILRRSTNV